MRTELRSGYRMAVILKNLQILRILLGVSIPPDCPCFCPCCGHGEQSFQHWILECPTFSQHRTKSLGYLDDLYRLFFNKYNNLFVIHLTPALEIRKTFHNYIFTFLLGGTLAFNELQIDKAEQRHLNEQLYCSSGSHVPYMEGLAAFLTKITPIISSSIKLLFDRFSKTPTVIKSADVVPIWQRNFSTIPYTGSNASSSTNESINDSWESLVDTTLSYLNSNDYLLNDNRNYNRNSNVENRTENNINNSSANNIIDHDNSRNLGNNSRNLGNNSRINFDNNVDNESDNECNNTRELVNVTNSDNNENSNRNLGSSNNFISLFSRDLNSNLDESSSKLAWGILFPSWWKEEI